MAKGKPPKAGSQKPAPQRSASQKLAPSKSAAPKADAAKADSSKAGKAKMGDSGARIFPVDTRFQQMARRAGGVPRNRAIERAQAALEEVKPGYDEWLEREVTGLAELVKRVEGGKEEPGWLETATFRSRQLRDSSGSLGYELLAFISGSLCELLDSIDAGSECNMESITCHVDALMLARQGSYRRMRPEQVPELTKGLQRVVKHVTI
jgi:hypothetical protein